MQNNTNNMVKNPETEVPQTTEMNDWDYLNDILATEKSLGSNYATAMNEASNENLYGEIGKICKETKDFGKQVFNLLFKKGWYKLEQAEEQKINTTAQEHESKLDQLG